VGCSHPLPTLEREVAADNGKAVKAQSERPSQKAKRMWVSICPKNKLLEF
jgi:hypothetical protein